MSVILGTENLHLIHNYTKTLYESQVRRSITAAEAITIATLVYVSRLSREILCHIV